MPTTNLDLSAFSNDICRRIVQVVNVKNIFFSEIQKNQISPLPETNIMIGHFKSLRDYFEIEFYCFHFEQIQASEQTVSTFLFCGNFFQKYFTLLTPNLGSSGSIQIFSGCNAIGKSSSCRVHRKAQQQQQLRVCHLYKKMW